MMTGHADPGPSKRDPVFCRRMRCGLEGCSQPTTENRKPLPFEPRATGNGAQRMKRGKENADCCTNHGYKTMLQKVDVSRFDTFTPMSVHMKKPP